MRAALLYPLRLLQPRPPPLSFNHPLPRTTHPFTWMNIDRHPTWNSPAARKKASFSAVTKATTLHVIVYSCARNAVPQFTGIYRSDEEAQERDERRERNPERSFHGRAAVLSAPIDYTRGKSGDPARHAKTFRKKDYPMHFICHSAVARSSTHA
ncbi:uncharacterized protein LOC102673350 isoform X1 [Apis dorsata]|uniref:uncharacterized protein LOC102673350 isoform X1 n=1 Tax=Apis dorsata TaxID=7462 RepID=UPI0003DF7C5D|nr:uncharacterized protein LOC102673350 isoform X1 [Apis dorsata]